MTESIGGRIQLDVLMGVYGSRLAEVLDLTVEDPGSRPINLGSSGDKHGYATFSDSRTTAEALRAFADKLDLLFGVRQDEALRAWQLGKVQSYEELLQKYGVKSWEVEIELTEFGHITTETHSKAEDLAGLRGVWKGQSFQTPDNRVLEVLRIEANWDGRPRAWVQNIDTGRRGWWLVEAIAKLFKE